MTTDKEAPIGVFDSGQGGVSTLGQAAYMLPRERLIYFGDSGQPPYALMDEKQAHGLCMAACDFLVQRGVKAIVVACNTATSLAIDDMRKAHSIPILGMVPALKVAVDFDLPGKIVVMATGMMLRSKSMDTLITRVAPHKAVIKLRSRDVITLVESGIINGDKMNATLRHYFAPLDSSTISAVVLGCTHFGFLGRQVQQVVGEHVRIADGNAGTIRRLKKILVRENLLNDQGSKPAPVDIFNSGGQKYVVSAHEMLQKHVAYLKI